MSLTPRRVTCRAEFNPQALPDATPPRAGVRPWESLIDDDLPTEERRAYAKAHLAGHGQSTLDPKYSVRRPATPEEVIASHLEQEVRLTFRGAPEVAAVLTSASEDDLDAGSYPFRVPVAIIGSTPPASAAGNAAGRDLFADLLVELADRGIDAWQVVAVDANRRWVERSLLVDDTDASTVRRIARVHLQPYLTAWRPGDPDHAAGTLEVVELAELDGRVVASAPARLSQLTARTCPIIPGAQRGDLCHMYGGPWTSSSISAAGRWERDRRFFLGALGCDTCGDGRITIWAGGKGMRQGNGATIQVGPVEGRATRHDLIVYREAD